MEKIVIGEHVNHHHRDTIETLFAHPTSRNIKWVDITSLLKSLGEVDDTTHGRLRVKLGDIVEGFEIHDKDATVEQVSDLRRMLREAGVVEVVGEAPEA